MVRRSVRYLYNWNFTFVKGNMTGSDFKDEWCPFRRNHFARSSAEMVSAEHGSAPT